MANYGKATMKALKKYVIDIFGLSNKSHDFELPFDDAFFEAHEDCPLSHGKGKCNLVLKKTASMITIQMEITGSIELECDRSLEKFDYPLQIKRDVIFKFGAERKELSEDVYVILKDEQNINIAPFLYEFIILGIPMKKLHPKFENEEEEDILLTFEDEQTEEQEVIDPRWAALSKLKRNEN